MKFLKYSITQVILSVIISSAIILILFAKVDFSRVLSIVARSNPFLIILAVVISIGINIFLGTVKWQRILTALGCPLTYSEVLSIRSGCIPLKVIFPVKSSEILKAVYLNKQKNLPFGRAVSSLLLDKTLNLFVTAVLFLLGVFFVSLRLFPLALFSVFLLVVIFLLLFSRKTRMAFIDVAKRIHPRFRSFMVQLLSGFEDISLKEKGILLFYSLLFQISEFINTFILFMAIGITVPFYLILVFVPLIMAVNNAPVTILGLGTREAMILFLFAPYGDTPLLLSSGILISFIEHVLPVVFGLFFLREFITFASAKKEVILKGKGYESSTYKSAF